MRARALAAAAALAVAGSGFAAGGGAGAGTAAAAPAHRVSTVTGRFVKRVGMADFAMISMHTTFLVRTDPRTRVTDHGRRISLAHLRRGWLLTVRGLEGGMHTVTALTVSVDGR